MVDLQSIQSLIIARLTSDPLIDIVLALLILTLIQTVLLSRRVSLLTRGEGGASLEHVIHSLTSDAAMLTDHAQKTEAAINNLDARLRQAVRGVAVRRFDPFQNSGGQQSFASAFLNEDGDGVVVSGIHARDGVRVYAKEVKKFASERELSSDEKSAIDSAKKKLSGP